MFHGRSYSLILVLCSLRVAVPSPYVTPWGEGAPTHKRRVVFLKMNNEQEMLPTLMRIRIQFDWY